MVWAVACPSGFVRDLNIRTLRQARELANDAAFLCICQQWGHRAVNQETGKAYDGHKRDATRNRGVRRCTSCGRLRRVCRCRQTAGPRKGARGV